MFIIPLQQVEALVEPVLVEEVALQVEQEVMQALKPVNPTFSQPTPQAVGAGATHLQRLGPEFPESHQKRNKFQ